MNKAICWKEKSDGHFIGGGTEYKCGEAYCVCNDEGLNWRPVVSVTDINGEIVTVDINDPDFVFIFRNRYEEKIKG